MGQAQYYIEQQFKESVFKDTIPQLKIKLAEGATMPSKANDSDSGYDLVATSVRYDGEHGFLEYGTGVFLHIPEGYEVNLLPRSSISKYDLVMCNAPGKVDEIYRKELFFRFKFLYPKRVIKFEDGIIKMWDSEQESIDYEPYYWQPPIYKVGDKIGQMEMRKKHIYDLVQVDNVEDSGRGGFGSSDLPKV